MTSDRRRPTGAHAPRDPPPAGPREWLIDEIERDFAGTATETGIAAMSEAVRTAMLEVPRERFVGDSWRAHAWDNRPLPIGHGQTVSQPFIVALMTELLALTADSRVLEIGTGCGYQTAVLARLAARVTSIEIVPELSSRAEATLAALGADNVDLHVGDGHLGWPAGAPFDAIIATAAGPSLPPAWLDQLAPGGRLVAPVGPADATQWLYRLHKGADGTVERRRLIAVRFVPMVAGG